LIDEHDGTQRSAREAAAAAAFKPPVPVRERERRRVKAAATLALLVLAVLGLASYEFVANAATPSAPPCSLTCADRPGRTERAPPPSW
jgi:hypothetical protein